MSDLLLNTAMGTYGHTRSLKDGSVKSPKFDMEQFEISPIPMIFRRMVRNLEFDVAEMALATYLCARAHGKAFTAIPIFLTHDFYHGTLAYNVKSGIKSPKDLEGRKVGVRSYTFTPGVWTRGILQSVYGVDLNAVTWVLSGDEHVAEYEHPPNVVSSSSNDLTEMLLSGEIDAAIGVPAGASPDIKPLFENAADADADWFKQTGVYPISHLLVAKNEQLENNPWLAEELFALFNSTKKPYLNFLHAGESLSPQDEVLVKRAKMLGGDPIPYGIEAARKTLETFVQFNVEQKVIPQSTSVEDLFPTSTLSLS